MEPAHAPDPSLRRGLLIVLSSPSGAGKTTISRLLLEADRSVAMSVSATTRPMRPGETPGRDYHFVDEAEFERMVAAGEFAEYATVFNHRYGTPAAPVRTALEAGRDILFDIDWQGTQQLKQMMRDDLVSIFLLPPTMGELERRLVARGTDSNAVIEERMRRAAGEIEHWAEYDYVLVNDDMDRCLGQVQWIVAAERLRRSRQLGLTDIVRGLIG
jgi:guanylate kinase